MFRFAFAARRADISRAFREARLACPSWERGPSLTSARLRLDRRAGSWRSARRCWFARGRYPARAAGGPNLDCEAIIRLLDQHAPTCRPNDERPVWMTCLDPKLPFDPMPPQQVFSANCRTDDCAHSGTSAVSCFLASGQRQSSVPWRIPAFPWRDRSRMTPTSGAAGSFERLQILRHERLGRHKEEKVFNELPLVVARLVLCPFERIQPCRKSRNGPM
jgi:hypothetical protein